MRSDPGPGSTRQAEWLHDFQARALGFEQIHPPQPVVAMLAGVLHSDRAIQVNIAIVRAFVRLREFLATHQDLAKKLARLERRYDGQFQAVFEAIRRLIDPIEKKRKRKMGFVKEG